MWPTPVTEGANKELIDKVLTVSRDAGVPDAFNFHALQFVANIAMFVPFGFFLTLLLNRRAAWITAIGALSLSCAVELVQQFALPKRSGDVWDVVANVGGAVIGVGFALLLRRLIDSRDSRVIARAIYFASHEPEPDASTCGGAGA